MWVHNNNIKKNITIDYNYRRLCACLPTSSLSPLLLLLLLRLQAGGDDDLDEDDDE